MKQTLQKSLLSLDLVLCFEELNEMEKSIFKKHSGLLDLWTKFSLLIEKFSLLCCDSNLNNIAISSNFSHIQKMVKCLKNLYLT